MCYNLLIYILGITALSIFFSNNWHSLNIYRVSPGNKQTVQYKLPKIIIIVIIIMCLVQRWMLPITCHSYEHAPCMSMILRLVIAIARPMLNGARSDSTAQSKVWCGQPDRQFQSLGKGTKLAWKAQLWSMDGSSQVMWPKDFRQVLQICVWVVAGQSTDLFVQNAGLPKNL